MAVLSSATSFHFGKNEIIGFYTAQQIKGEMESLHRFVISKVNKMNELP